ncbi:MAG: glycosyltransferase family 39 protein [Bacteroidetes bacterium]|nr:glycosyltransferase family 39 protein [Bacteroidota bacterium]
MKNFVLTVITPSKYRRLLTVLFIAAMLYGSAVLVIRNYYESGTGIAKSDWNKQELSGDAKNFMDRAVSLSAFRAYDSETVSSVAYYRPPGYSLLMAAIFFLSGVSIKAVIVFQIILAAFIVVLIADSGRILFDFKTGMLAGILGILYYPLWNAAVIINSELLSMLYWVLSLNLILRFVFTGSKKNSLIIFAGLFSGLAAITRGQFLMLAPVSLLLVFFSAYSGREKIAITGKWISMFLIPVLLWTFYAYIVSGVFVIVSTQGFYSMWWGWSPAVVLEEAYPVWNQNWSGINIPSDQIGTLVPNKSPGWFISEIYNFIVSYPKESALIGLFKIMEGWGIEFYDRKPFLQDLFRFVRNKKSYVFLKFLLMACIIYTGVSLLTAALYRYRFPLLDPVFIILSSYTLIYLFNKFAKRKSAGI